MNLMGPRMNYKIAGIGDRMLDRDHDEISGLLLEMNFFAKDEAEIRKQRFFRKLSQLTLTHFALEEEMMSFTGYPGMEAHVLRHQAMIHDIRELSYWPSGQKGLLARLPAGLLWESHTNHVEKEDQAFGLWLNGQPGLSARIS